MEIEIVVNNWFYIMIVRPRLFHETETVSDFVKKNMVKKLNFVWKHLHLHWIQICSNHGPRG